MNILISTSSILSFYIESTIQEESLLNVLGLMKYELIKV
jgi:hypothetical protein